MVVKPNPLSGFPELLPQEQIVFQRLLNIIREGYELFGFSPIETPAVERKEVLTSKGGDEKEIYSLTRLAGSEVLAILRWRFTLTLRFLWLVM